jgi:Zn-dependent protease
MTSDFNAQLKEYSELRKSKFENEGHQNNQSLNEGSLLLQDRHSVGVFNFSSWIYEKFTGCIMPNYSVEVMTLPVLNGIPLHVHSLWLFFILVSTLGALQISLIFAIYSLLLGGPVLFFTVLVHELGHAYMAIKLGGVVNRILLWPLGGLAYISFFGVGNPRADALVAIAGPLTHLPQVAVWMSIMALSTGGVVQLTWPLSWGFNLWVSICSGAICIQIALFLFNLIPAYPLDGGRLFGALLEHFKVERNHSFLVSAVLGGVKFLFYLHLKFDGISRLLDPSCSWWQCAQSQILPFPILAGGICYICQCSSW